MSHILHSGYRFRRVSMLGILGILLLVLAACGLQSSPNMAAGSGSTTSSAGSTTKTPVSQPTPTSDVPTSTGDGSVHGCPSDASVVNAPKQANVTIKETDINSTVVAHVGDIIEIRLPFGQKWSGPTVVPNNLQAQQPTGYASTSENVCIWRFVAQSAGTAKLDFSSRALCLKGVMCPMYIALEPFTIDVQ